MKSSEHDSQVTVIHWAFIHEIRCPELAMLFAVPNGGLRNKLVAIKLRAEGVKAGVPDLMLPVSNKVYHGLVIEMKYGKNTVTDEQKLWLERFARHGWKTAVCYSADAAIKEICEYLKLPVDMLLHKDV